MTEAIDRRTAGLPGYPAAWSGMGPGDSDYRYVLWWLTGKGDPRRYMAAIGCNPSTATETKTDPTVARWIKWAGLWGYGAVAVLNRYAFRTPHPSVMRTAADPVGPENPDWIVQVGRGAAFALASWGNIGAGDDVAFAKAWNAAGCPPLHCLGVTGSGAPIHPLARGKNRVPDDVVPVLWTPRVRG